MKRIERGRETEKESFDETTDTAKKVNEKLKVLEVKTK